MTMAPHALAALLAASGAAFLMLRAGLSKNALERRRHRVCPSCGRRDGDCSCRRSLPR